MAMMRKLVDSFVLEEKDESCPSDVLEIPRMNKCTRFFNGNEMNNNSANRNRGRNLCEKSRHEIDDHCDVEPMDDLEEFYRNEVYRLRQLLNDGGALIPMDPRKMQNRPPPDGVLNDLLNAISAADLDLVSRIITGSWDLNVLGKNGLGPLHVAARTGSVEICRYLIRLGARIRLLDHCCVTPENHAALVCKLDEFHQAVTEEFLSAAARNKEELIKSLIEDKWNVNSRDVHGLTALHKAAAQGNKKICQILLKNGACIDAKDVENETAAQKAKRNGQSFIVDYLVQNGAESTEGSPLNPCNSIDREPKHRSSFQQVKNSLSMLKFWDKNRKEKGSLACRRLSADSSGYNSPRDVDCSSGLSPSTPQQVNKRLPAIWNCLSAEQKAQELRLNRWSTSSRDSCDETQCSDKEHQLWGQFLDPCRR
eukprot:g1091.t1